MSKKEDRDFQHESLQDTQTLISYLKALTEGFESGRLHLGDEGGDITLEPRGLISLEVRAQRKRDRIRLSLRFGWRDKAEGDEPSGNLRINGSAE